MPYGPLVQWHQRTNVCGPSSSATGSALQITGVAPCAQGTVQKPTPYVTMVWQIPVAGGPLAIQPPDIQIVEALGDGELWLLSGPASYRFGVPHARTSEGFEGTGRLLHPQ